ncbi:MAG: PhoH family protein [Bacteroidales bacterium]
MSRRNRKERKESRNPSDAGESSMKGRNNTPNTHAQKTFEARDTSPLVPLNQVQSEYINAIYSKPVVICTGVWGSAKTYIPSVIACDLLQSKQIDGIVIARPAEGKAKSVGFFKGSKEEKLSGWAAPILDIFKKRLGTGHVEAMIMNGKIEMLALEQVKGRSWDNKFIIVDEAEDLDTDTAKSLVGRQGINSTMVITGDINQKDLKAYSGLELLLEVSKHGKVDMELIDFDSWDYCVRSEEAKQWGMAFERYEEIKQDGRHN